MRVCLKYIGITILVWITGIAQAYSQCAMCRATIENNVSNGDVGIAASLNFGILYLFAMPYIAVGTVAYLWYKKSKANEQAEGYSQR